MRIGDGKTMLQEQYEAELTREMVLREAVEPLLEIPVSSDRSLGLDVMANISLAISMKRIADEICGTKEKYGVTDSIREAIEQGILNATRR